MKRFKKIIAAALVCILMMTAATGCGGLLSSDWSSEATLLANKREDLYWDANQISVITSSSEFSAAVATASLEIKSNPDYYLKGYEDYFSSGGSTTVSRNASDYSILLDKGPSGNSLYRILLYDGDMSISEIRSQMDTEFTEKITANNIYKNMSYEECLFYYDVSTVMIEVVAITDDSDDECVLWAVFELVQGMPEEPALA